MKRAKPRVIGAGFTQDDVLTDDIDDVDAFFDLLKNAGWEFAHVGAYAGPSFSRTS